MISISAPADSPADTCLTDSELQLLVAESTAIDCEFLTRHLDACDTCRQRLDLIVADAASWREYGRRLSQAQPEPTVEIDQLKATLLRSLFETLPTQGPTSDGETAVDDSTAMTQFNLSDTPGRMGRYVILNRLGQGGMGIVYLARDTQLQRDVAIKLMTSMTRSGDGFRERFLREARALAAVRSDHVVQIHSIEQHDNTPFLVMEYVSGGSLQDRLARTGPLDWRDAVRIAGQVASGLQAAHDLGIIHRDVKPGNILLDEKSGRVKLTDFGLARSSGDDWPEGGEHLAGTPEYMSPEHVAGEKLGPASDQYSLGCVLFAMGTGKPPLAGCDPWKVLHRTVHEQPPALDDARPEIPPSLAAIVDRLLHKSPADRFANMAAVQSALAAVERASPAVAGSDRSTRAATRVTISVAGLAAILLAAVSLSGAWDYVASQTAALAPLDAGSKAGLGDERGEGGEGGDGGEVGESGKGGGGDGGGAGGESGEGGKGGETDQGNPGGPRPAATQPLQVTIVNPDSLLREQVRQERASGNFAPSPFELKRLAGHQGPVKDVAYTPDGRLLISCSGWPLGDKTIRVWDVATGQQLRQCDTTGIQLPTGLSGSREAPGEWVALAVTPDGQSVVVGGSDGALGVWDIATGRLLRQVQIHAASVYALAVSPDGHSVLSAGREEDAVVWDLRTGERSLTLPCQTPAVRAVAFSPDGKLALTGTQGANHLRVWDLAAARKIADLPQQRWVWSISHSPTGRSLAFATATEIRILDLEHGTVLRTLHGHTRQVSSVAYSPDGTRLISAGEDNTVRVWDVQTGEELQLCLGHQGWVWKAQFAPDGQTAVSAGGGTNSPFGGAISGQDFALRIWRMPASSPRVAQ